jgi:hypothetical protein
MALQGERERHAALQQALVDAQSGVTHHSAGAAATSDCTSDCGRRNSARSSAHASPAYSSPTAMRDPSRQQTQVAASAPNAGAEWHVSPDASLPGFPPPVEGREATATPASRPADPYLNGPSRNASRDMHGPPPNALRDKPDAAGSAFRRLEPSPVGSPGQLHAQRCACREEPHPRIPLARSRRSAACAAPPAGTGLPSAPPWLVWCDILVRELAAAESEAEEHCGTAALARRAAQRAEDVQDALERRLVAMDEQLREELAASASTGAHPPALRADIASGGWGGCGGGGSCGGASGEGSGGNGDARDTPATRGMTCGVRLAAWGARGPAPVVRAVDRVGGEGAAKTFELRSGQHWASGDADDSGTKRIDDAGEVDQVDESGLWAAGEGMGMCGRGEAACRVQSRAVAAAVRETEAATEAMWRSRVSSAEREADEARRDAAAAQARAAALAAQLEAMRECVAIEARARAGAEAEAAVAEGRHAALLARLAVGDTGAGRAGSSRFGGSPAPERAGSTPEMPSASPTDRLQQEATRPQRRGVLTPGTWAPANPSGSAESPAGTGRAGVIDVATLVRAASMADAWPA